MSDGIYIAYVGAHEIDRCDMLAMAQAMCVLKAPRGAEASLRKVRHEPSGDEWVAHREGHGWHWTKVNANRLAARSRFAAEARQDSAGRRRDPDPERWPTLPPRADIDG
jgi:hypothetical protein